MISHDMEAALKYAGHILHIEKTGSFYGTKLDYIESDLYKSFHLNTCRHKHTKECFQGGEN